MEHARPEQTAVNDSRTRATADAGLTQPRSLSDLRSWLHGYRIRKTSGELAGRASVIISHIDREIVSPAMYRAADELAILDPSLSWLPAWKPRVTVAAKGEA